jgi:hypothetical protein
MLGKMVLLQEQTWANLRLMTAISALPSLASRKCCAMHQWLVW